MKAIYLFLILSTVLLSCKKSGSKPEYTVNGKVMDGTANRPFINVPLQLVAYTDAGVLNYKYDEVGRATTASDGTFTIKYTATDITGSHAHMALEGSGLKFEVPINQDVNKTFYNSPMGKLSFYLYSPDPINNDTLFLSYGLGHNIQTDTILKAKNGFYRTINAATASFVIAWGRGINQYKHNIAYSYTSEIQITGDPVVDSFMVSY
jgi:hypothetical protein